MTRISIQIQDLSFYLSHKTCFENFSAVVHDGERIAVIGRNGSGKTSLLKMLFGELAPSSGLLQMRAELRVTYVPQVISEYGDQSGGEGLMRVLRQAFSEAPDLILLDEPTNHLDRQHRESLSDCVSEFRGTLIFVSHDQSFLREQASTVWHIDQGKIQVFDGEYEAYQAEYSHRRRNLEDQLKGLKQEQRDVHASLMREQMRAAKSRQHGEKSIRQRKWPTIVSDAKARRAETTHGSKASAIHSKKQEILEQLSELPNEEILTPKFHFIHTKKRLGHLLSIVDGQLGYLGKAPCLQQINFVMQVGEKVALIGNNGAGKSTLIQGILNDPAILKQGEWHRSSSLAIGYLDQHYRNLTQSLTVLDNLKAQVPKWSYSELRKHLNDFLFRKNEEVNAKVSALSGGEKARLSLALIAAKAPDLLLLDEITNNLDRETTQHILQVLQAYSGAMIIISHDSDFIQQLELCGTFVLENQTGYWRAL